MTMSHGGRPQRLKLAPSGKCSYLGAVIIGDGVEDYACGGCFAVVVKGFELERLSGSVLRCSYCGCLNEATLGP